MPVIQKCTFCGTPINPGSGKLFIRKDAKMIWLCSNKCEKNLNKLGRKSRNVGWTEEYRIEKKARMAAVQHHEHAGEKAENKTHTAKKKVKA